MVRFILAFAFQSNDFKSSNTMKLNNTEQKEMQFNNVKPKASPHLAKGALFFFDK